MNTEEKLREQMQRALGSMPGAPEPWDGFRRRDRRYRMVRGSQAVTVSAVIVAIAVMVGSQVAGRDDTEGFACGDPADCATPDLPGENIVDRTVGYTVRLPGGWRARTDEGAISAFAPTEAGELGEGGSVNVPSAYYVTVVPTRGDYDADVDLVRRMYGELEADGAKVAERETLVAGRPAVSFLVAYPQQDEAQGSDDESSCSTCVVSDNVVYWVHGYTLRMRIVARTADADTRWGEDGRAVIAALTVSAGTPYAPESGTVGPGVAPGEATETVAMFMDARFATARAERFLAENAKLQFDAGTGGLNLYPKATKPYFEVIRRDEIDANSSEYVVWVVMEYSGPRSDGWLERITMGPGQTFLGKSRPQVIRSAHLCTVDECK